MGWFDSASDIMGASSQNHHKSSSSSHSHGKNSSSSGNIFGVGSPKNNSSRSSFFGFNNRSSSSYYKRSPRSGYLKRAYAQLRRLLRDLIYYMKKHPMKVFMLVIMPLITGGALTGLLARFGIKLPGGLEKMFGAANGHGGMQYERTHVEGPAGAFGGLGSLAAGMGGVGGAMSIAKMFI